MNADPTSGEPAPVRYCANCGEIFSRAGVFCPACGVHWRPADYRLSVPELAGLLAHFAWLYETGALDRRSYLTLRTMYERQLVALRPPTRSRAAGAPVETAASSSTPALSRGPGGVVGARDGMRDSNLEDAGSGVPDVTPAPEPGMTLAQWTAQRQADILLYLGAFFLSVAALIFVGYQGNALGSVTRFLILVAYTAGFLTLGVLLPRWERVREAGAVFLGLGAVLTPVCFVALYTQALGGRDVPVAWIWLAGSMATAGLYLLLAARGYGWLYVAPGALAVVVAWLALGAVCALPPHWFGAWIVGGAALALGLLLTVPPRVPATPRTEDACVHGEPAADEGVPVHGRGPAAVVSGWVTWGAIVAGAAGLLVAHAWATGGAQRAQLPVAYALATTAMALEVWRRRSVRGYAALPALGAMTALAVAWAAFDLAPEWYGCFAVASAFGYLLAGHVAVPARARTWGSVAGSIGAVALLYALDAVDQPSAARWALPATLALTLTVALAAYVHWRWWESLACVPPLVAALGAAGLWAVDTDSAIWLSCWIAAAGLGYLALAAMDAHNVRRWRAGAAGCGAAALAWGHMSALVEGGARWHLPSGYALVLAGAAWDGARRRDAGLLALPALAAMLGATVLWATRVDTAWWLYPALVAAACVLVCEPWWRGRPVLRVMGWPYVLLPALVLPLAWLPVHIVHPGHGLASFLIAAALFAIASVRARGAVVGLLGGAVNADMRAFEGRALVDLCFLFLVGAAGFLNAWSNAMGATRAWAFVALGSAAWAALTVPALTNGRDDPLARRGRRAAEGDGEEVTRASPRLGERSLPATLLVSPIGMFVPRGVLLFIVATYLAAPSAWIQATVLALATAWPLASGATRRQWALAPVAAVFGAGLVAAVARWAGRPPADVPLAYVALGAALWAGLVPLRTYGRDERGWAVALLSWGYAVLATVFAWTLVLARADDPGVTLVRTREWVALALAVAAGGLLLVVEGVRLRRKLLWAAGSAVLLCATLLGIAVVEPKNVQAYTLPAGIYLIALGLTYRRSSAFLGEHMARHEALIALGVLTLVLPPVEQSFAPGGAWYGLELIVLGLLFLAAGFVVPSRWLVASGVLTLSGVAVRRLQQFGTDAPYWLTLGIVGMVLLAVGLLLLFQRDWWDRARTRIGRWWRSTPAQDAHPTT